jgi:putative hydrolase of the HAD superfamily
VAIRAVLFDLGNTLIGYYTSSEFPGVLRRCLEECTVALGWSEDPDRDEDIFKRALLLNRERSNFSVRPLGDRLQELFGPYEALNDVAAQALAPTFLKPIFATARLDPEAISALRSLRSHGVKCAIVSNTPWGSPAMAWREELTRHGLLNEVDATVFCVDVGWRKPHRAPFDRALALLGVVPVEALFVGDDHRWDVIGARNAGVRPVLLGRDSMNSSSDVLAIRNLGDVLAIATDAYS